MIRSKNFATILIERVGHMLLIGIDPGFSSIGYSAARIKIDPVHNEILSFNVFEVGVFHTKKDKDFTGSVSEDNFRRTLEISKFLNDLLVRGEEKDIYLAVESMSFPRNASIAAKMSLCWGAIAGFCFTNNIQVMQFSPNAIKELVTGKKRKQKEKAATKEQVEAAIRSSLDLNYDLILSKINKGDYEHAFDSLGALLSGYKKIFAK